MEKMVKSVIFVVYLLAILFDSSESVTIECEFKYAAWSVVTSVYTCWVSKGKTIDSLETAYVESASGTHQSGHTNDNVNYLYFTSVKMSYFPRGIDAVFKNLKGIRFDYAGLKEIHQSDLKPFPKMIEFLIYTGNNLEVLEEGLFDFNPDLEYINLSYNTIAHIDSTVFDSLTKLRYLHLNSNTCINKGVTDRTSVLNLIKELKTTCNNSEYSSLDHKLKFLQTESPFLTFEDFKADFDSLKSKIKASKFMNFYQTKLQGLKAILDKKSSELNMIRACNESFASVSKFDDKIVKLSEHMLNINKTVANIELKISSLKESFENFNKEASTESKDNFAAHNEHYAKLNEEMLSIKNAVEGVDTKLEEVKTKINNIKSSSRYTVESDSNAIQDIRVEDTNSKLQDSEMRFSGRSSKIMKALKVIYDVSDMALN